MLKIKDKNTKRYIQFGLIFLAIFVVTFCVLYVLGLVPEELLSNGDSPADAIKLGLLQGSQDNPQDNTQNNTQSNTQDNSQANSTTQTSVILSPNDVPIKIQIPIVGVDAAITDPNSTDNAVLNEYLLKGAVRYPGTGYPGSGNLFLFGHSSTLAVVHNQAFKTFNKIENLKSGDEIYIYTNSAKYTYKVRDERRVEASQEEVNLDSTQNMLTLSTCDLLGSTKEFRYVVRADFVGKENV